MIRDNLKERFPRQHFNKAKKTKQLFENKDEADDYISAHRMRNYTSYLCGVCGRWHIGNSPELKNKNSKKKT